MATSRICSIPDCGKPSRKRGWCSAHHSRWTRHGDPLAITRATKGKPLEFLVETVLPSETDDCIFWPYGTNGVGYGYFKVDGIRHYAHRYVCEASNGPAPTPTHQALHSCAKGQMGCVNPRHLRWGTPAENMDDRRQHGNHIYGELHGRSKLTAAQVERIRELAGTMTNQALGDLFNVTGSMIGYIRKNKNWSLPAK